MRASHSLKGAARIVGLDPIVHLTHAMEDRFVSAQKADSALTSEEVDRMLKATDWLAKLQAVPEAETAAWLKENTPAIEAFTATFTSGAEPAAPAAGTTEAAPASAPEAAKPQPPAPTPPPAPAAAEDEDIFGKLIPQEQVTREHTVRIAADRFDQILSLASESLVLSRKLCQPE